jgi:hypothetical protein
MEYKFRLKPYNLAGYSDQRLLFLFSQKLRTYVRLSLPPNVRIFLQKCSFKVAKSKLSDSKFDVTLSRQYEPSVTDVFDAA